MKCALCHEEKYLCKSHIIPEFLYATLYDESHRFISVSSVSEGIIKQGQKGFWERLLCKECEGLFAAFERHSRRMFVDALPDNDAKIPRMRLHPRLDYTTFKLFCLSILWRSSVSNLDIFKHVRLGPHEEQIRQMLMSRDSGGPERYPIQVFALHMRGEHIREFIVEPSFMRAEGHLCYRYVMMGFVVLIYVSSHRLTKKMLSLSLQENEPIRSFDAEVREFAFLRELWRRVGEVWGE